MDEKQYLTSEYYIWSYTLLGSQQHLVSSLNMREIYFFHQIDKLIYFFHQIDKLLPSEKHNYSVANMGTRQQIWEKVK